jgi:hypothetical protein
MLKRDFYERLGVPAYWIVDPAGPSLLALRLVGGGYTVESESSVTVPDRLAASFGSDARRARPVATSSPHRFRNGLVDDATPSNTLQNPMVTCGIGGTGVSCPVGLTSAEG